METYISIPKKEYIIDNCKASKGDKEACLRTEVYAMILTEDNKEVFGSNWINNKEVEECPRKSSPSGVDYHLCREICNQEFHAEIDAIINAQKSELITWNSKMYIVGKDYCCNNCLNAMKSSGISYALCLDSGKEYYFES